MRLTNFGKITLLALSLTFILSACKEQDYQTESIVYEDGSIDRKIHIIKADSIQANHNIFGVNQDRDWEVVIDSLIRKEEDPDTLAVKDSNEVVGDTTYDKRISFSKHFISVEEANQELDEENAKVDTLFRIKSSFKKRFRWFVTYLDYSDTYVSANRFHEAPVEYYFAAEDYSFLQRMPASGKPMPKADMLYYNRLSEYIKEDYFNAALLKEYWKLMIDAMHEHQLDTSIINPFIYYGQMLDSEYFYMNPTKLLKEERSVDDSTIQKLMLMQESENKDNEEAELNIPSEVYDTYYQKAKEVAPRKNFMTSVFETEFFSHSIKMPWNIVCTNADSISGRELFWKPQVEKFAFSDYAMLATSRKLNLWAWIVTAIASLGVIGLIIWRIRR